MMQDLRIPKKQITFTGKLLDYKDFRQYSDTFIETGTAMGDGVQRAIDADFKSIHSIEAMPDYFIHSFERFATNTNVTIWEGLSVQVLPTFTNIKEPCVFFLDAHPAGPGTAGHEDFILNGEKSEYNQDTIIKHELEIILSGFNRHVIIIDDVNGLNVSGGQYMNQLLLANPDYKFFFYDENLSGDHLYKDKILVAIP